jgi:flagellar basal body-associated protein FliL
VTYTDVASTGRIDAVSGNGAGAPKPKKSKKKRLMVLIVAVVVAAFAADKFVLSKKPKPTKAVPGTVVLLPETTLNLADGSLLQVKLAIELQKGVGGKSGSLPAWQVARIEDDEITTLSGFSQATLLSSGGKAKAMTDLLNEFRAIAGPGPVGPAVMAVYYTDFVMQ